MKNCAGELSMVFLQPVGLKSDKTKMADTQLAGLAADFGMTDIKSVREGEHQAGYLTRNNTTPEPETKEPRPGDAAIWGQQGPFNMNSILAGSAFQSVRGEQVGMKPRDAGLTEGPKPSSYIADHENLKLQP
ncbi:MAG: hypothetical protein EBR82_12060 [Caulobacteraceae bacterium]|nr:hypothetical protein [Caulobacteraceae bacterium]